MMGSCQKKMATLKTPPDMAVSMVRTPVYRRPRQDSNPQPSDPKADCNSSSRHIWVQESDLGLHMGVIQSSEATEYY